MKCPFRTGIDGEFLDCYGQDCMAYYEYSVPTYNYSDEANRIEEKNRTVTLCKRMASPSPYFVGGCKC